MEFYYYSRMGKTWQSAYHAILTGLEELRPAFPVPRLEMEELGQILFQLRLDHPGDLLRHRLLLPGPPRRLHGGVPAPVPL